MMPDGRRVHASRMSLPQTLAQKLIAKAAGLAQVQVGDVVTCDVDLAMFHQGLVVSSR